MLKNDSFRNQAARYGSLCLMFYCWCFFFFLALCGALFQMLIFDWNKVSR